MNAGIVDSNKWWGRVSEAERRLVCEMMRMLRGAKRSPVREVALAAAKWESGIGFFIKVRLTAEVKAATRRDVRGQMSGGRCQ